MSPQHTWTGALLSRALKYQCTKQTGLLQHVLCASSQSVSCKHGDFCGRLGDARAVTHGAGGLGWLHAKGQVKEAGQLVLGSR